MSSPLITLLLLVLGVGFCMLLANSLIQVRSWVLLAALVGVLLMAVYVPVGLRNSGLVLDGQRTANKGVYEEQARERCLLDMGRGDLVASLGRARAQIPEDARFSLTTHSPSLACFTLNLLPRLPVRQGDFDPTRDWRILDRAPPGKLEVVPPNSGAGL